MKRSKKLLLYSYILVAVFMIITLINRGIAESIARLSISLRDWGRNSPTKTHAYLASFLLSIIGNTTIFIPFPYVAIVFIMTSQVGLDPLLLGIISGFGAAIGEVSSYILGFGGGRYLEKHGYNKKFESLHAFLLKHRRLTPLIIYILAATPLPDDVLMIPLGILKYGLISSIIPCFLGKTTMLLFVGYFGSLVSCLGGSFEEDPMIGIFFDALTVCLIITVVYIVVEYDWTKFLKYVKD